MGFFAPNGTPSWHPARKPSRKGLMEAKAQAMDILERAAAEREGLSEADIKVAKKNDSVDIANLALGFALRRASGQTGE